MIKLGNLTLQTERFEVKEDFDSCYFKFASEDEVFAKIYYWCNDIVLDIKGCDSEDKNEQTAFLEELIDETDTIYLGKFAENDDVISTYKGTGSSRSRYSPVPDYTLTEGEMTHESEEIREKYYPAGVLRTFVLTRCDVPVTALRGSNSGYVIFGIDKELWKECGLYKDMCSIISYQEENGWKRPSFQNLNEIMIGTDGNVGYVNMSDLTIEYVRGAKRFITERFRRGHIVEILNGERFIVNVKKER